MGRVGHEIDVPSTSTIHGVDKVTAHQHIRDRWILFHGDAVGIGIGRSQPRASPQDQVGVGGMQHRHVGVIAERFGQAIKAGQVVASQILDHTSRIVTRRRIGVGDPHRHIATGQRGACQVDHQLMIQQARGDRSHRPHHTTNADGELASGGGVHPDGLRKPHQQAHLRGGESGGVHHDDLQGRRPVGLGEIQTPQFKTFEGRAG